MAVAPIRLSSLFLRTLRDDPADAEVASHRLLVRAGYVRRAAPGIYSWLPLGWQVLRNVERIVREEMDAAGFQEVHFPALLPREPYERTGRWAEYGDNLFRLKDRRGGDYLLGPTHEEMFTLLVKDICTSYKDLPVSLYQIQTKYRDEARPRAGMLRGREFVMKDSYSFDIGDEGLQSSYAAHRAAYIRTFDRLGLPYMIVAATSGAMGGSAWEEFLAPLTRARTPSSSAPGAGTRPTSRLCEPCPPQAVRRAARGARRGHTRTPRRSRPSSTCQQSPRAGPRRPAVASADTLKNVACHGDPARQEQLPLAIGVPGDREVDLRRLEAVLAPDEVAAFDEADFAARPHLVKGYIGPGALGEERHGVRYLIDPRVADGSAG